MAAPNTELYWRALFLVIWFLVSAVGQNLLSCETASPDASGYRCNGNEAQDQCKTFAILRANSYYSSLYNLSFYLGLNRFAIAEANGFSADTQFLPIDQPLLIPIDCKCSDGVFQAEVTKIAIKGESFHGIAESLEGLTSCKAIQDKNSGVSPWYIGDKVRLQVPLRCSCPSSAEISEGKGVLLSYPVRAGDKTSNLATKFNTTVEAIVSANKRSLGTFKPAILTPFTTILIPVSSEHILLSLEKPREPNLSFPATSIPTIAPHKKKVKKRKTVIYIAIAGAAAGAVIAIAAVVVVIHQLNKKKQNLQKGDAELQQLSLSVRTTSDKKISFDGSQDTLDGRVVDMPRKTLLETYTMEELKRATEDFSSSNHIEGTVYHGRLKGKSVAIKRMQEEMISKIDVGLFRNAIHRHPNIIRLFGICTGEGHDAALLVFEFAKNGSLKDWLHGGLAMKNQFIASCDCFLTWNQRLRICLDVAMALQYMHHAMNPSYVHRNIKSHNIFLDEDFHAKIGNFGMARCVEADTEDSEVYLTNPASWSQGYLAPEYVQQGVVSPSMDIFAYGVVLLEVLTGQTPVKRPNAKGEANVWLSERKKSITQSENADELREWMDSALAENYPFEAAVTLANLAEACVEEDPSLRPTAGEVVEKLSKLVGETAAEGEHILGCESSSKPLVMAAARSH
ncbi:protein LYK2 [Tripterygium wilfordii]|nr:protein LYK2 [Tripterygium wilfordii]